MSMRRALRWRARAAWVIGAAEAVAAGSALAQAPIITDGTMGARVELSGPEMTVPHTLGTASGGNLFHSFQRFNVPTDGSATFTGPAGFDNVIGRVTGGEGSLIDGRLRSTVPGADVWLINPAGITFGPAATLDVPASFHVSTADEIRFPDGARFSADLGANSTLSVAPPQAFGFLGAQPQPVVVDRSNLAVPPGETLALAGGGILSLDTILSAPRGEVRLSSVGGPGEVGPDGSIAAPGGIIGLAETSIFTSGEGGGGILIRGGIIAAASSFLTAENYGASDASKGVAIAADATTLTDTIVSTATYREGKAGSIDVRGDLQISNRTKVTAETEGTGTAGDIHLDTPHLQIGENSTIVASTSGDGDAGNINVEAGLISINSSEPGLTGLVANADVPDSGVPSTGKAGNIAIQAERLELTGPNALVIASTFAEGDGGVITVNAQTIDISGSGEALTGIAANADVPSNGPSSTGNAGSIAIKAEEIRIAGGGGAISSVTFSSGNGGSIAISAGRITIQGTGGGKLAGISTSSDSLDGIPPPSGRAGNILITANEIILSGESGGIRSFTAGPGDGGNVTLSVQTLLIEEGAEIQTSKFGTGQPATIDIVAQKIQITGGATTTGISSDLQNQQTVQESDARIFIQADELDISGSNAKISSTTSGPSRGGLIAVIGSDKINIVDGGEINTSTTGSGDAGSINISSPTAIMTLRNGSIDSNSFCPDKACEAKIGAPGDVHINVDRLRVLPGSVVTASNSAFFASNSTDAASGIIIDAETSVELAGTSDRLAAISTFTNGERTGGNILIKAPRLELSAQTFISSSSLADGKSGNITVFVGRLNMGPGTFFVSGPLPTFFGDSASGSSSGGEINIAAADGLTMNAAGISSASTTAGPAGAITISTPILQMTNNAVISSEADNAGGGNITIEASERVQLQDSNITSSVFGGETTEAGNIMIDPKFVILDNSTISATARDGKGGRINVVADYIFALPEQITATSERGIDGTVALDGDENTVVSGLTPLPDALLDASGRLQARCAVRGGLEGSSFTIAVPEQPSPAMHGYLAGTFAPEAVAAAEGDGAILAAAGGTAPPWPHLACRNSGD